MPTFHFHQNWLDWELFQTVLWVGDAAVFLLVYILSMCRIFATTIFRQTFRKIAVFASSKSMQQISSWFCSLCEISCLLKNRRFILRNQKLGSAHAAFSSAIVCKKIRRCLLLRCFWILSSVQGNGVLLSQIARLLDWGSLCRVLVAISCMIMSRCPSRRMRWSISPSSWTPKSSCVMSWPRQDSGFSTSFGSRSASQPEWLTLDTNAFSLDLINRCFACQINFLNRPHHYYLTLNRLFLCP